MTIDLSNLKPAKTPAKCKYFILDMAEPFDVRKMGDLMTALYNNGHLPMFRMIATNEMDISGTGSVQQEEKQQTDQAPPENRPE